MIKQKNLWILGLLLLAVALYYFFLNPYQQTDFFMSCPFYKITGYQCPGCGSQRAFHDILHFHFLGAFKQNALFVLGIPYVLLIFYANFNKEKHQKLRQALVGNKTLLILLIVAILFGVLRNL